MKQTIIYVELDVDHTQYRSLAFNKECSEFINIKYRSTLKGLPVRLNKIARHFQEYPSGLVTRYLPLRYACGARVATNVEPELLRSLQPDQRKIIKAESGHDINWTAPRRVV